MDKLELLTDDRSGNEVSTTDLVKKMKILVANPKYDVDQAFLREINVLSEETVQAFLIREIAKLLQRTRHFDAIRVIVEPYLMILGITFEDLMLYIEQGEADLEEYLEEEFAEEDLEFDYGEGVEAFDETEMEDFDEEEMDEEEEEDVSSKLKQPIQTPIGIEVEEIEVASTVPVA